MKRKSHYLSNEFLEIEIAEVGAYSGSRFDWTGFITQVQLKNGGHTFCVMEKEVPLSSVEGTGICNEFGITEAVGYDESKVGEQFPKLGVGLLTKQEDAPYFFKKAYPIKPYPIDTVYNQPHSIEYIVHPEDCRGYATKLTKKISLHDASLHIDYTLQNVGIQDIRTNEYTHNFIGINQLPMGPDYILKFSFPIEIELMKQNHTPDILRIIGNEIHWNRIPEQEFYCKFKGVPNNEEAYWELIHKKSGIGMREISHFPISVIAIWGTKHVVSPEFFIDIHLKPGEVQTWRRTYDFFKTEESQV
jgi:hypothetical protein